MWGGRGGGWCGAGGQRQETENGRRTARPRARAGVPSSSGISGGHTTPEGGGVHGARDHTVDGGFKKVDRGVHIYGRSQFFGLMFAGGRQKTKQNKNKKRDKKNQKITLTCAVGVCCEHLQRVKQTKSLRHKFARHPTVERLNMRNNEPRCFVVIRTHTSVHVGPCDVNDSPWGEGRKHVTALSIQCPNGKQKGERLQKRLIAEEKRTGSEGGCSFAASLRRSISHSGD